MMTGDAQAIDRAIVTNSKRLELIASQSLVEARTMQAYKTQERLHALYVRP